MKYAVYPYTLDNLYLSKVSENLLKSDISYIVPGGKVSEVYNSGVSMIYSMANIMSMQEVDFDKVIIVDSNMVSYEEYDNAIKVFLEKNVRIILATGIYDEIIYIFLTIFLYLLKCPQSLILSALRAFCFCGKPHISRSIFLYFRYQAWLKSW